ncbi:MAG: DUF2161 family putative PD-(D/E)XK-type phosphodiesterase [Candidatus Marinimicrobia bacterium]|nr:DUF2161 family putative PD-(D/E)XK-type phosphodiesterase [Candidatus Neomarinimicrobiota bacterium]
MQEVDLYPPLKKYLVKQGYQVKGEVQNCDVVAIREPKSIVVIELKLTLNLTVLLQAVDRIKITDTVYIGVPTGLAVLKKQRKKIVKLMRMLGLGLIVIDPKARVGNVDVLCDPGAYRPRQVSKQTKRLLGEFQQRVGDPNPGGSNSQRGLMTAYRQKALSIAEYLSQHDATKAAVVAQSLSEPKTRLILYNNVYGWFDRLGKGVYNLSPRGKDELPDWLARNR